MSSADTTPITAARFAAALQDLSLPLLHRKVREINNAIAKLQYSNDQLLPFTRERPSAEDGGGGGGAPVPPDQDCVEAIAENEGVIERMKERLAIIYIEVVENRGVKWEDLGKISDDEEEEKEAVVVKREGEGEVMGVAGGGGGGGRTSAAWTDGTFQTGTIRNGEVHVDAQPGVRGSGGVGEVPEEDGGLHL